MNSHVLNQGMNREQRPAQRLDNPLAGTVSRHRLDSLNTSNDLLKRKKKVGNKVLKETLLMHDLCIFSSHAYIYIYKSAYAT